VRLAFKDGKCEAVAEAAIAGPLRDAVARVGGESGSARAAGGLAVRHFDAVGGLVIVRVGLDVLKEVSSRREAGAAGGEEKEGQGWQRCPSRPPSCFFFCLHSQPHPGGQPTKGHAFPHPPPPPPHTHIVHFSHHTQFRSALPRITSIAHRAVGVTPLRVCGRPASMRAAAGKAAGRVVPASRGQVRLRAEAAAKLADVEL